MSLKVYEDTTIERAQIKSAPGNQNERIKEFRRRLREDPVFQRMMDSIILDDHTDEEISHIIGIAPSNFKVVRKDFMFRKLERSAKGRVMAETIHSARRLAEGFTVKMRTFVDRFNFDLVGSYREEMIEALEKENYVEFHDILKKIFNTDLPILCNITEKYYPPQKDAIFRILEAYDDSTWDKELKKKKIPQKSIVVTMDGEHLRKLDKRKNVEADYTIEK